MNYTAEELFNLLNEQDKYHLSTEPKPLSTEPPVLSTQPLSVSTQSPAVSTQPLAVSTQPQDLSTPPRDLSTPPRDLSTPPYEILKRISALNKREHDKGKVESIILDLCNIKPLKASEIAGYFQKDETYFKRKYLSKMIAIKKLKYLHPEMINHPEQAYLTNNQI